jgi:Flp pilus assembly protein TadG
MSTRRARLVRRRVARAPAFGAVGHADTARLGRAGARAPVAASRQFASARIVVARRRGAHRRCSQSGQASVELVAFLPLLLLIALAVFSFAAAQAAREEAGAAAEAAALALLQGRDAREAARAALPKASRERARISITGESVRVRLRPRLPLLADRLAANEEAHAGP